MKNDALPLHVETVPSRLTVTRLPNGWQEFFCYLTFPSTEATPVERLFWHFDFYRLEESLLSGRCPITKQEQESGRVALAMLLPPSWQGGRLVVEMGSSQHSRRFQWEVAAYRQAGRFQLPFAGRQVLILGGHRIGEVHRSAQIASQQMGWDMIPLGEDGLRLLKGLETEALHANDFVAFGQPVLAPAAGHVVQAVDGQPDLIYVGQLPQGKDYYLADLTRACGNYVIINHGDGVWSCLAHLRQGSVQVEAGKKVKMGQTVGELGNSGFSSGPHLHIHFMDGPDFLTASPLPIEFDIEGETYAPQSGEIVSSE